MSTIRFTHVTFSGCPLPVQAVQMADGLVGATLRSLCAALSLDYASQNHRIRRIPALREAVQSVILDTAGGPQAVDVVPAWAIPVWLAGLHISRLPEAKRALILAFQREAVATIERAFARPENEEAAPAAPSQSPAPQSLWQSWHVLIDRMEAEYGGIPQELRAGQQELSNQLAVVRHDQYQQGLRIVALEAKDASPAAGLSGQRLEYLFRCAHQFQQRHGNRIDDTLAGLAAHFRVENIYYLPEKDWPAVLEWFTSLLEDW